MASFEYSDMVSYDEAARALAPQTPRTSTQPGSSSSTSKRGSMRIARTAAPTSSPHSVQRRRTTTAHANRQYPKTAYESAIHAREQRLKRYYGSRYSMPVVTPIPWLPESDSQPTIAKETNVGNTIVGMENLTMANTPTPTVQESIQNAFSMAYGYPVSTTPTDFPHPQAMDYGHPHYLPQQYPNYLPQPQNTDPMQYSWNDWSYNMMNGGSINHEMVPTGVPTAEQSLLTHQMPVQAPRMRQKPPIKRKKSKELVGIGLYNDKEPGYMSALNPDANRESLGKELKLEQTWSPPDNAQEVDDEEEAYSSEEGEEVDEMPALNDVGSGGMEAALYPAYSDLSNHSFFFNDEDQLCVGNNYGDLVAMGENMQASQGKIQPPMSVPTNFMYI